MKKVKGHRYLFLREAMYYFKRGVPAEVRGAFQGRAQVWTSLKTGDLRVARIRLQRSIDEFENTLSDARGQVAPTKIAFAPYKPSKTELDVRVREAFVERQRRTRPVNRFDPASVEAAKARLEDLKAYRQAARSSRGVYGGSVPTHVIWQAQELCEKHGWSISEADQQWGDLVDQVVRAQIESAERELQLLEGIPETAIDVGFAPSVLKSDHDLIQSGDLRLGPPLPLLDLFLEYVAERNPSPATIKSFKAKIDAFERFLGHDDARKVTKRDVSRWKDFLLAEGRSGGGPLNPKTVRATFLSAIKVTLKRGFDSGQLPANVAEGVGVAGRKKSPMLRSKGFSDAEAKAILMATLTEPASGLSPERKLAIRWVPWLCAYTGARVNELTQLRALDVAKIDEIWTIRITPDAGSTKDGNARVVALHPHLIKQGFQQFASPSDAPIFYDPSRSRCGSSQNPQSKKVGEFLARWVRKEVGITDKGVAPNHGWRHRFKTIARDWDMRYETREYIQGHSLGTEGGEYGDTSPNVTFREISKIPRYDL
ncbi:MAG: DUF6538 domain-containing protein [Erythrobacter sp.]